MLWAMTEEHNLTLASQFLSATISMPIGNAFVTESDMPSCAGELRRMPCHKSLLKPWRKIGKVLEEVLDRQ